MSGPREKLPLPAASIVRMCRARDLIRERFAEPITLDDCAVEAELSPWHLLRSFRATFGETPKELLTRIRLERARHLLTVTSRSVLEICLDVGFSSLGTFTTLFKRHVGVSPGEYRRLVRPWVTAPGFPPWTYVPSCFVRQFGKKIG
jgi:AraC-like DNA-binding protein